jgi:septum formation inhibitor MinC
MTQYKDKVEKQREILEQEKLDNQITALDFRYKNNELVEIITRYGNGKQVTEYKDKRKKDKVEWL